MGTNGVLRIPVSFARHSSTFLAFVSYYRLIKRLVTAREYHQHFVSRPSNEIVNDIYCHGETIDPKPIWSAGGVVMDEDI